VLLIFSKRLFFLLQTDIFNVKSTFRHSKHNPKHALKMPLALQHGRSNTWILKTPDFKDGKATSFFKPHILPTT
jgi:hypothetical protein